MGYMHISNLYKSNEILLFKQCYAMEKIHGTSAHVSYDPKTDTLTYFSGGAKHESFLGCFDHEALLEAFRKNAQEFSNTAKVTIYGEAYGGSMQGMGHTYGPNLKFIAFEVKIEDDWLDVPRAERFALKMGQEFVYYEIINTTEDEINAAMMADSVQAVRNGMGPGHPREGVVLRPLIELQHPNGGRIMCKHKRPEFAEREHTPKIADPEKQKALEDAQEIADEWVVPMRLQHVLDAFPEVTMADTNKVIAAMIEDVEREAEGEIVPSKEVRKAIGKKTVKLLKDFLAGKAFE